MGDEKVPIKKAASKEPPKKVVASKNEVKKPETSMEKPTSAGAATKSLASPLDTPRASGRARKVLDYNAMAKGLDSAEKKPAEKNQGTKRKADSISNQDATPAKKKDAVETPKKKPVPAKKTAAKVPAKAPAKAPEKAPAKATPKATPAPLYPKFEELKAARESAEKKPVETPQPTTETAKVIASPKYQTTTTTTTTTT